MLSIAGSDSGGGAGIQADLKAFARCGVHGMTAITAITAQNTVEVRAVEAVSPEMIIAQVSAVADDIGVDAIKIGMLGTAETVLAVERALQMLEPGAPVVIDPVMVAESGAVLLDPSAREALVERLLPRATVVTPNLPEARVLAGRRPDGDGSDERAEIESLARAVHALGPDHVVVTGGHRDAAVDLFFDGEELDRDPGGAISRRRGARLGLHALLRARGAPGARALAAGGRARGARHRLGGRARRVARGRRGRRARGRVRSGVPSARTARNGPKPSGIIAA